MAHTGTFPWRMARAGAFIAKDPWQIDAAFDPRAAILPGPYDLGRPATLW
tara:strand:+ start:346 stop:495 length:150 start_codon:yes stop_codon:yes gene_type:complete